MKIHQPEEGERKRRMVREREGGGGRLMIHHHTTHKVRQINASQCSFKN